MWERQILSGRSETHTHTYNKTHSELTQGRCYFDFFQQIVRHTSQKEQHVSNYDLNPQKTIFFSSEKGLVLNHSVDYVHTGDNDNNNRGYCLYKYVLYKQAQCTLYGRPALIKASMQSANKTDSIDFHLYFLMSVFIAGVIFAEIECVFLQTAPILFKQIVTFVVVLFIFLCSLY